MRCDREVPLISEPPAILDPDQQVKEVRLNRPPPPLLACGVQIASRGPVRSWPWAVSVLTRRARRTVVQAERRHAVDRQCAGNLCRNGTARTLKIYHARLQSKSDDATDATWKHVSSADGNCWPCPGRKSCTHLTCKCLIYLFCHAALLPGATAET